MTTWTKYELYNDDNERIGECEERDAWSAYKGMVQRLGIMDEKVIFDLFNSDYYELREVEEENDNECCSGCMDCLGLNWNMF